MAQPSFIELLKPIEIVDDERVKNQFVSVYQKIHNVDEETALSFYEKERIYAKQTIQDEKTGISICTPMSVYSAFLEIAIQGLSIKKQAQAQAYLEKKSSKIKGQNNVESWVNVCALVIQAHGELALRVRAGQLAHAFLPVVVYEGDTFNEKTNDKGELYVEYAAANKSTKIIGCWVRLALKNGLNDFKIFREKDIERLHKKSMEMLKNDKGNALYSNGIDGQIDVGFFSNKNIKTFICNTSEIKIKHKCYFGGR